MIKDRDHARELIAQAGITNENVTKSQLDSLWRCLQISMVNSGNYDGTYAMNNGASHYMTCCTNHWSSREAVSFNRDGFIGFAGWADNKNIRPILDGVEAWLKTLKKYGELLQMTEANQPQ